MANTDLTSIQITQIDEFTLKNMNFGFKLSGLTTNIQGEVCIPIGNASQLGTLLSRLDQKMLYTIPNLMDYVKQFDPCKYKYLILSSN
jgi:hypothetical protein